MRFCTILMIATLYSSISVFSQGLSLPSLSPNVKVLQSFSTSKIELSYGRPSMRGRKVFGGIVPYDSMWRTGANFAPKLSIKEDLIIGGEKLKAGSYSLYTIPGRGEWEVIVNGIPDAYGLTGYDESKNVARFKVKAQKTPYTTETMSMMIEDITYNTCNIVLRWENIAIAIPVKSDVEAKLVKDITKAVENPSRPYYYAASYYNYSGKHLDKAMEYVTTALKTNGEAWWLWHLKADIASKLKKKDLAISCARKAIVYAKGSENEYEQKINNERIINQMNLLP